MAIEGEARTVRSANEGWPLVKTLDLVAVVLTGVVVIRAVGGLLAGLGVASLHFDPGAQSGSGLVIRQSVFAVPTYLRLFSGTQWADVISGMLLLGGLALIALPRLVWDVSDEDGWMHGASKPVVAIGVVSVATTAAAVIGTVNWLWHWNRVGSPDQVATVAQAIAAVVLAALCSILAWFGRSLVRSPE